MRNLGLPSLALAFLVAACNPGGFPNRASADCAAAFMAYDVAAGRVLPTSFGVLTSEVSEPDTHVQVSSLRRGGCVRSAAQMPPVPADATVGAAPSPLPTGGPLGYVHVATVTGQGVAASLTSTLRARGWPVESRGAPSLGRRVFIGPVNSADAQAVALAAARDLGFGDAYTLPRIP